MKSTHKLLTGAMILSLGAGLWGLSIAGAGKADQWQAGAGQNAQCAPCRSRTDGFAQRIADPAPQRVLHQRPRQPAPSATPSAAPTSVPTPAPSPGAVPVQEAVVNWSVGDAVDLLAAINAIGDEGLFPADYQPDQLRAAIKGGAGPTLDAQASQSFAWLVEDLRDGRTPMTARIQWFAVDPDQDENPTTDLMQRHNQP
jgi:hypothetical protein